MAAFRITHRTRYRYSERVFLEPHLLRLSLRPDRHLSLASESIRITPEPSSIQPLLDVDGSRASFVSFKGMTDSLEIESEAVLSLQPFNPFDFLIYPDSCANLPMAYPPSLSVELSPYLPSADFPELGPWVSSFSASSGPGAVAWVMELCRRIHGEFHYEKRAAGAPLPPGETLKRKKGSCRDFVTLAMAACRRMGLACRYVSGYCLHAPSDGVSELHAWMEVFLPGAGWRGFDPTQGIACDQQYLALSTASDPALTMPVTGSFRGEAVCHMSTHLSVVPAADVAV